ncbi:MAG: hypothetical protein IT185_01315 [Acidobacteria bacterium]|nr:hypothetical protein [Acidobacteriota bacterium]
MPHYLVSGFLPDNFDPSSMTEANIRDINALNDELEAAGVRHLAGGLAAPSEAKTVRLAPDGDVLVTDGPYLEAKEFVGGLMIIEAADMDEALTWCRRSVNASGMPSEVREIPFSNLPHGTPHPSRGK